MLIFRKALKGILSLLARRAIKRHDIELVVVTGFFGTEVVKEGIYQILNQKYKVRRNTNQIVWDMSLPLAVLGFEDRKRNWIQWIFLIARAAGYLLLGQKNKHTLILNANCTFQDTAKFWSSFLKPDYLVVLNYEKESAIVDSLIESLDPEKSVLIYDASNVKTEKLEKATAYKRYIFSADSSSDLIYKVEEKSLQVRTSKIKLPSDVPNVLIPFYAAIFSLCINRGFSFEEVGIETLKFDLDSFLIKRIEQNIGKARSI